MNTNSLHSTDYYPFGMVMSERSYSSVDEYRFGFNGQEKDLEVNPDGNSVTALFWQYDARLGRRWNVDPVKKPWESVYACFRNKPIYHSDPNGDDVINGDAREAKRLKKKMDFLKSKLDALVQENNIDGCWKRKDYLKANGKTRENKKSWREYKKASKKYETSKEEYEKAQVRAQITQGIIDKWEESAPNLFKVVNNEEVHFVLYSIPEDAFGGNTFGYTEPKYDGTRDSPQVPKEMRVVISETVKITEKDGHIRDSEYALNHEAGHFLYISRYISSYVQYYYSVDGRTNGGHAKGDESGVVARKLGAVKDIIGESVTIFEHGN